MTAAEHKPQLSNPDVERQIAIKGALRRLNFNGRRIALKNGLTSAAITETISGRYRSPSTRSIIAREIRERCEFLGVTLTDVGLTPSDICEE